MEKQRVIYLLGDIEQTPKYYKAFEAAEDELSANGFVPLSPARLPEELDRAQRLRTHLAMIDSADAVLILPAYFVDSASVLEKAYIDYIGKPSAYTVLGLGKEVDS